MQVHVLISAAGGVDLKEARSAIFNGANIVVANIVDSEHHGQGFMLMRISQILHRSSLGR